MANKTKRPSGHFEAHYDSILGEISHIIDAARKSAARSANCLMTAAYWLIGRRIVESEQKGEKRAAYGEELLERLSASPLADMACRFPLPWSAKEHWVHADENPPVGLILCARKDEAVTRYALEGLPNKVMAEEYRTALPDEKELAAEIEWTQAMLQDRKRLSLVWRKKR